MRVGVLYMFRVVREDFLESILVEIRWMVRSYLCKDLYGGIFKIDYNVR